MEKLKDIKEYTMEELCEINRIFVNEIESRKRVEREEDWNKVVDAIKDFVKKYGGIEVSSYGEGGGWIDCTSKFDSIGEINC